MRNLNDISFWKQNYGLLPINLNPKKEEDRFLMLNGGISDFCFQSFNDEQEISFYHQSSWSTNTKNYLIVDNNKVKIINWHNSIPEEIPINVIESNISKFYKYLVTKSFKTQNDVVPFIIDIFKQLRNVTLEKQNPKEALSLLFLLLVSIEEDYTSLDYNKWEFEVGNIPDNFEYYVEVMRLGVKSIKPNLDLILRHTSGALFQEAHRDVVYFNPQRDLFGGVSNKLIVKTDLYSSIHYTPQYLARTIVENCLEQIDLSKPSIKIFDPSCGSSEFLIESLKQLKNLGYSGEITVKGYDISESAINTSKFLLAYENRAQWDGNINIEVELVSDSLTEDWGDDNDLILMNPPFVSWELTKKENRDIVLDIVSGVVKKGRPNQASAFFYKAKNSVTENGVLGCVIPSSILTTDAYSLLRNEIQEELTLNLVGHLGNFVFEDALTDVSIFVGKKPKSATNPKIIWTKNEKGVPQDALREFRKMSANNEQSSKSNQFTIYTPEDFPILYDSWKIISLNENNFIRNLERFILDGKLTTISKLFTVKQGIRSGNNNAFIISKEDFELIPNNEKKFYRKVLGNESIRNGVIKLLNYIWYPYNEVGSIFRNEEDLKNTAPVSYERLLTYKEMLLNRPRNSELNWWNLSEHRAWLRNKESRLYSTEFGKSDSFGVDKKGEYVVERGNAWTPKKTMTNDDFYFYLSVFSSSIFDKLLAIYSKPIMAGFYLGQVYTKDIPIPDIKVINKLSDEYLKLVEFGKELSTGNSFAKYSIDEVLSTYFYPNMN